MMEKKIEVVKRTGAVGKPGRYVVRWAKNVVTPAVNEEVTAEQLDHLIANDVTVVIEPQHAM